MNTSTVKTNNHWENFWERQTTPLYRHSGEKWWLLYAKEINLILTTLGYTGGPVLETGCGDGSLFDHLEINKEEYLGIDLSDSMLAVFRSRHPHVNLVCTNAAKYSSDRKFSLIFSNQVIQYFSQDDLDIYINNALEAIEEDGIILLANILWKDLEFNQYHGGNIISYLKSYIKRILGRDNMGYWYSPKDFEKYQRAGVEIHVFGSLFYPYRFSLALKKTL
jgi:cyclopropane fatty-acyl-phospholipid synthase-like methyltransferase